MKKLCFTKMVASGNDFVVIEDGHQVTEHPTLSDASVCRRRGNSPIHQALIRKICDRKFGIGADGLLVLEKSQRADVRMRIFNADGSEAEMCGNGARCVALFVCLKRKAQAVKPDIETQAGIIKSEVKDNLVKIKLTDPKDIKLNIPLVLNRRSIRVNFINTGVPHTVIFVEGLRKIDVEDLGNQIRFHRLFKPQGTNVDFVEVIDEHNIQIRTYERGVEDETLACGTGSVAAAIITGYKLLANGEEQINVHTQGREVLKVYFKKSEAGVFDVWLQGKAECVFKGEIAF